MEFVFSKSVGEMLQPLQLLLAPRDDTDGRFAATQRGVTRQDTHAKRCLSQLTPHSPYSGQIVIIWVLPVQLSRSCCKKSFFFPRAMLSTDHQIYLIPKQKHTRLQFWHPAIPMSRLNTNRYTRLENLAWSYSVFRQFIFCRKCRFMKPLLFSRVDTFC